MRQNPLRARGLRQYVGSGKGHAYAHYRYTIKCSGPLFWQIFGTVSAKGPLVAERYIIRHVPNIVGYILYKLRRQIDGPIDFNFKTTVRTKPVPMSHLDIDPDEDMEMNRHLHIYGVVDTQHGEMMADFQDDPLDFPPK